MTGQRNTLIEHMNAQGLNVPYSDELDIYNTPLSVYGKTISNRIGIQPLEGFDSDINGGPTDMVRRRYLRFTRGGAGLIWFEACAVSTDGKSNPYQMSLTDINITEFKNLIELMDNASDELQMPHTFKVLQLTHSGRMSRDRDWNPIPLAARAGYNEDASGFLASDERVHKMIDEHIHAATLAMKAGFDAVDIKVCHGYFLSELLSAYERPGIYGGSFENRTRALFQIVDGINDATNGKMGIAVRLNAYDSVPAPYGYAMTQEGGRLKANLHETVMICQMLRDRGVKLIDISASSPSQHLFGPDPSDRKLNKYISSVDLLKAVKQLKDEVPGIIFMCTGLSAFGAHGGEIGAGGLKEAWFDIAGFGRQALAYPDFAGDLLSGSGLNESKCCTGCNLCFKLMDLHSMTGCVTRDKDIYLPAYKKAAE